MIQKLFENLHPAINKDPMPSPSLQVNANNATKIVIRDGFMQISGQITYDLTNLTIHNLAQKISSLSGFNATDEDYGSLSALALVDGIYTTNVLIPIFTNPVWQYFRALSMTFKKLKANDDQLFLQSTMNSATGMWLDALGERYNVVRLANEPDILYAIRVFDFSLGIRINNIAIQKILNDLGYASTVDDAGAHAFNVNVTLPTNPPQGFTYSTAMLGDLVDLLRAAGVQCTVVLQGTMSDQGHTTEGFSSTTYTTAAQYGSNSGRVYGRSIYAE